MSHSHPVIALVEDDLPTNRAFARLLRAQGYEVETFVSAERLLACWGLTRFDCMLLDINLDGMSGLDLQRRLQQQGISIPIIFMTGGDDPGARSRAYDFGCSDFLHKPFSGCDLVEAISNAMAGPHSNY
ncbi:MAG: response regulator [Pseudomonadota bacterium]